jgi:hypothetical protein
MNRRTFFLSALSSGLVLVAPAGRVRAAKLPTSRLTVSILSVDREAASVYAGGTPTGKTTFVATAQILSVLDSDHGLSPGATIAIRYDLDERQQLQQPDRYRKVTLRSGETATLTVFGSGGDFRWHY